MDTRMMRQEGDYDSEFIALDRDGITTITATGTTGLALGGVPLNRKLYLMQLVIVTRSVITGGNTILATFKKKNGATVVSLNAPVDTQPATGDLRTLLADVAQTITINTPTVTDANRIFQPGDCLVCDIVAAGTVTAQPSDMDLMAYFKILR